MKIRDENILILKKVREILEEDGINFIMDKCNRLLNSGCIDKKKYNDDNYLLPKIILHVALLELAEQYKPSSKDSKKEVKNLKYF